jgi:hypothetical protein
MNKSGKQKREKLVMQRNAVRAVGEPNCYTLSIAEIILLIFTHLWYDDADGTK